jgi:hypothetical protein
MNLITWIRCSRCQADFNADYPEIYCRHIKRYAGFSGFAVFMLDGVLNIVEGVIMGVFFAVFLFFFSMAILNWAQQHPKILEDLKVFNNAYCQTLEKPTSPITSV